MFAWRHAHTFPGGIHPPQHKTLSTAQAIGTFALPGSLYLPLQQHAGQAAIAIVDPGEHVYKSQLLAKSVAPISAPIHAPTSGIVRGIEARPVPHPSGLNAPCIVLDVDGHDTQRQTGIAPAVPWDIPDTDLIKHIQDAGIVGLGGAAFPAAVKMQTPAGYRIDTLLINGAECEPYISCDDMLMRTQAHKIWQGIHLLCRILRPRQCILAIEDNKPLAIRAMRRGLQLFNAGFACSVHLRVVPTIYPTGGERQLIKIITGMEVPSGKLPLHVGVVCQNVATAKAIADAVFEHMPLTSRLITVTGDGIRRPGNYQVMVGTPIRHVIEQCGGLTHEDISMTMGGPMMGMRLHSADVPVIKGMNCLLIRRAETKPKSITACIRCGQCARACPMSLLPQQLYRFTQAKEFDKAKGLALMDCIECGCCEYVCPAQLPLVQYYRYAKSELRAQQRDKQKAEIARERHAKRQQRIEAEQALKQQKRRRPATAPTENTPTPEVSP